MKNYEEILIIGEHKSLITGNVCGGGGGGSFLLRENIRVCLIMREP